MGAREPRPQVDVPSRSGARIGDGVWVSGTIGDAGLGLSLLRQERDADCESRDLEQQQAEERAHHQTEERADLPDGLEAAHAQVAGIASHRELDAQVVATLLRRPVACGLGVLRPWRYLRGRPGLDLRI